MKDQNLVLEAGEIINFSTGEYSDYEYCGSLIITKTINIRDFFLKNYVGKNLDSDSIPSQLVAHGYALPLECREFHIGSYGDVDFADDYEYDYDKGWIKND